MPTNQNPKTLHPEPAFPQKKQSFPGQEHTMNPKPDYGVGTYKGMERLKGMSALITGGDSGIGRAVAYAYACEGADVVISHLPEEEKDAKETIDAVQSVGQKCISFPGDIRDEKYCQKLVQHAVDKLGKLDILINNAAYQMSHESIVDISSEEFDRVMKTNIYAVFYLSKFALPVIPPGGSIINTASIQAYQPSSNLIHYAMTKGAVVTFTKALAQEAIKNGVRVNAVAPGPIWTPLIPYSMDEQKVSQFGGNSMLERPGQPSEVAPVYVFLASTDASFVTSQIYGVTGGKPLT